MLYDQHGRSVSSVSVTHARPEPQPEQEEAVRRLVKSIDDLLDVKWFPYAVYSEKSRGLEGRYGLICTWPNNDPRWAMIQSGEIEESHDLLGWFCEDIHDATSMPVSVDSIESKIIELLGKSDGERMPHTKRMKQILEKNSKHRSSLKQDVIDQAEDVARTLWSLTGKHDNHTVERIMREIGELKNG